jgi:sugar phosphate isomerase/epimerase
VAIDMPFELGYNTNGFAHHRLADALNILADIGYQSVAITLDHHALNPFDDSLAAGIREVQDILRQRNLCCVIETGARFLLDPLRKHQPSLLSSDESQRRRRIDFLRRATEIAVELEAEAVSFWSGAADASLSEEDAWSLLEDACDELLTQAVRYDLRLAFEPEPGMFVERMDQFARLTEELVHPRFGLTLDVGHLHCLQDGAPAERIRRFADHLFNVHIEDMRVGRHEHLMFGEGEIDFPPIFAALEEIGYTGSVNVELSRHSHDAVTAARKAFEFLDRLNR